MFLESRLTWLPVQPPSLNRCSPLVNTKGLKHCLNQSAEVLICKRPESPRLRTDTSGRVTCFPSTGSEVLAGSLQRSSQTSVLPSNTLISRVFYPSSKTHQSIQPKQCVQYSIPQIPIFPCWTNFLFFIYAVYHDTSEDRKALFLWTLYTSGRWMVNKIYYRDRECENTEGSYLEGVLYHFEV